MLCCRGLNAFLWGRVMRLLAILFLATAIAACSGGEETTNQHNQMVSAAPEGLRAFAGKPFSALVEANPDFRISERAITPQALAAFSGADGIQNPGEIHKFKGRDILVFTTCRRDHCSTAANLIVIDLVNSALHIVNTAQGKTTVVVDGPPDISKLVRTSCEISGCNWETETPVSGGAYQ